MSNLTAKQQIIMIRLEQYPTDILQLCDYPISTVRVLEKKGLLRITAHKKGLAGTVSVEKVVKNEKGVINV